MRKLMWFTIGFAAACAVSIYLSWGIWLAAICFVAGVSLFFLRSKKVLIAVAVLFGIAVGSVWSWGYDLLYLQGIKAYDGENYQGQITVGDYSFETDYGVAFDGEFAVGRHTYRVRVYMPDKGEYAPGDCVVGEFRLRLTTRDSLQGETYHQGDGIFLLAYGNEESEITRADAIPLQYYPALLCKNMKDTIDKVFPEDTVAFARALLLGDSSLLSYEQDTVFKISGIRHIIAVSGLHVSFLLSLVYFVTGYRRVLTAVLGIPVLILFAAVAGFTPSVVRACIMQGLMIGALLFNKEYDPPTALAFAVLTMLGINPITITSVSFQLSVGCLVGIFLFYQKINGFLVKRLGAEKGMTLKIRLKRWLCGSVSVTLSTMIATTPLSAIYFGTVSLSGILTNLLTLWVVAFVFYGIMLACVVALIFLPVAKAIAWVIAWPIRYIMLVAKGMSGFVLSAVYTCSIYIVLWLILCYFLLAVFALSKKKRPLSLAACMLAGLAVAVSLSWTEPLFDSLRVTVLDVGQGQSILFQSEGRAYLVDCGGDSGNMAADTVSEELLSQGVTRLDGLILTHYDIDHTNGVLPLLSRIKTENLYLPDIADDGNLRSTLEKEYAERITWIREPSVLSSGDMKLTLFPGEITAKDNECCLSILCQTEDCDILVTGDLGVSGEQYLLENAQLPELELLVVGHHGAASSAGYPLLSVTKPAVAVISVGEGNSHGHPSEDVLFRLKLFDCSVRRTDLHGTIRFRR